MKKTIRLSLSLLIVAAISALSLGLTDHFTSEVIKNLERQEEIEKQKEIFPEADDFQLNSTDYSNVAPNFESLYEASKDGKHVGYVCKIVGKGYGGELEVLIGIDLSGTITGLRIGQNSETAGIGDKVTKPEFYEQFTGKNVDDFTDSSSAVDTISGATISSSSVLRSTVEACKVFKEAVSQ